MAILVLSGCSRDQSPSEAETRRQLEQIGREATSTTLPPFSFAPREKHGTNLADDAFSGWRMTIVPSTNPPPRTIDGV